MLALFSDSENTLIMSSVPSLHLANKEMGIEIENEILDLCTLTYRTSAAFKGLLPVTLSCPNIFSPLSGGKVCLK